MRSRIVSMSRLDLAGAFVTRECPFAPANPAIQKGLHRDGSHRALAPLEAGGGSPRARKETLKMRSRSCGDSGESPSTFGKSSRSSGESPSTFGRSSRSSGESPSTFGRSSPRLRKVSFHLREVCFLPEGVAGGMEGNVGFWTIFLCRSARPRQGTGSSCWFPFSARWLARNSTTRRSLHGWRPRRRSRKPTWPPLAGASRWKCGLASASGHG